MGMRPRTVLARRLRRAGTDVEQRLWRVLREGALPWKFRRQHPIGHYVVDFACPARKLAIELDGGQHFLSEAFDRQRSAELAKFGYRAIRFWNNEVNENLSGVLQTIARALENPPPPLAPPPPRAEGDKFEGGRT
jgi:very-short-patch-repair endonuclease